MKTIWPDLNRFSSTTPSDQMEVSKNNFQFYIDNKKTLKKFSFSVELYILYYLEIFGSSSCCPNGIPDWSYPGVLLTLTGCMCPGLDPRGYKIVSGTIRASHLWLIFRRDTTN